MSDVRRIFSDTKLKIVYQISKENSIILHPETDYFSTGFVNMKFMAKVRSRPLCEMAKSPGKSLKYTRNC